MNSLAHIVFLMLSIVSAKHSFAVNYPCSTNDGGVCGPCSLSGFHRDIYCTVAGIGYSIKPIDDCVGNDDGQMVHGLGLD